MFCLYPNIVAFVYITRGFVAVLTVRFDRAKALAEGEVSVKHTSAFVSGSKIIELGMN
jgi:hypothetical protein